MEYMRRKKSFVMLQEQNHNFALDKTRPVKGYIKLETGDGQGAIRVGADNLRCFEHGSYIYKLLLFGKKNEKTIYKIAGDLILNSRGRGETYLRIDPADVDGNGNSLELFTIAIVVAVSSSDRREPLHPILKGDLEKEERTKAVRAAKQTISYDSYYNRYVLQCCQAIQDRVEMYDRTIPFKEDKTKASWRRVVNLGKFPMVSPGARYMISRYRHFIFGEDENHYLIGVPGRYLQQEQPEQGASGFVLWQPIMGAENYRADRENASLADRQVAYGYWIAAVNKQTGSIERL